MTRVKLLAVASAVTMVLALSLAAAPIPPPFHNISGYEFATGGNCPPLLSPSTTCGVSFLGWIGGKGPVPNGWKAFPGNTQGLWEATINYEGTPSFGNSVTVDNKGVFDLMFKHHPGIEAMVTGGTVTWPKDSSTDRGCGPGVATVDLTISSGPGGPTSFQGCLHDLPALSVLPPKIWGSLQ